MRKLSIEDMNKYINDVKDVVCVKLKNQRLPHSEIVEKASQVAPFMCDVWCELSSDDQKFLIDRVVDDYENDVGIKTFDPYIVQKQKESEYWLYKAKNDPNQKHAYFNRYKHHLRADGFSNKVIENLESTCEKILARCANPKTMANIDRKKGLVVGDVQSGKTSNYLGLINMAYDYGYKIVVLLAGTTNSLRIQTQKRTDKGTVGAISDSIGGTSPKFIGVGEGPKSFFVIPFTDQKNDFLKFIKDSGHFGFNDLKKPVVLVVKKNKGVLEGVSDKLQSTLDELKSSSGTERFDSRSILIIDDEADNASINTRKDPNKPTAINNCIRDIFNKFPIASYVGFTATPFANIFIDHEDETFEKKDLFPSDFIVQLNTPSNYFGGRKVFPKNDEDLPLCLQLIKTEEKNFLPVVHDGSVTYDAMAESLKHAIHCFLINNVIRTIRGHKTKHRSMMINITRYNSVQDRILKQVQKYIEILKCCFEQLCGKSEELAVKNENIKKIHDIFCDEFFYGQIRSGECGFPSISWMDIQRGLLDEIKPLQVVVINSRNGNMERDENGSKKRFDYDDYETEGARVIAIGGLVLSRGLTLEGLMISYYSRNASAYDTLLQMCRWFGYRPKYEDLCRVYMTELNVSCFGAVLDAVENLKEQFAEMDRQGKAPKDFGLMVRESPDTLETSLLITSRNKMRGTHDFEVRLNYGGVSADTSKLYIDPKYNIHNIEEYYKFAATIGMEKESGYVGKRGVLKNDVADFIRNLSIPIVNKKFDINGLCEYIENSKTFLQWDVVIAEGKRNKKTENGAVFHYLKNNESLVTTAVERQFNIDDDYFRIGRCNNRVMEPSIFKFGLSQSEINDAESVSKKKGRDPIVADYLGKRTNPLLVIYPIDLKPLQNLDREQREFYKRQNLDIPIAKDKLEKKESLGGNLLLAFAIGFPGTTSDEKFVYRANKKKIEELTRNVEIDDEDEGADEEDD